MAKKVAVPSMVGTTVDSAETALTDSGLGVVKRYVSGEPDGTIYSQDPRFPGKLAKGDLVTIDILRAPEAPVAPAPVDLSGVTKSLGELTRSVAELKATVAELNTSVAGLKTSVATKDAIVALGKDVQDVRERCPARRRRLVSASCRDSGAGAAQGVAGRRPIASTGSTAAAPVHGQVCRGRRILMTDKTRVLLRQQVRGAPLSFLVEPPGFRRCQSLYQ